MTSTTQSPAAADWRQEARRFAGGIRRRVLEHVINNNGGYLSQACSSAETFAALYTKIMKLGPSQAPMVPAPFPGVPSKDNKEYFTGALYNGPRAPHLDRFYMSPAHYGLVLYAALIEAGRMSPEGLAQFNRDGASVEMIGAEHSPGMEVTTGSLGQGLSQAMGVALARKLRGETGRSVVFMSDGEFHEGQTWEAIQIAVWEKLDRVIVYVDVNRQCCDGAMDSVLEMGNMKAKLRAFGARVIEVDGHDLDALVRAGNLKPNGKPVVVLCNTDPCREMDLLRANAPKLHYLRFKSAEEKAAYAAKLRQMQEEA